MKNFMCKDQQLVNCIYHLFSLHFMISQNILHLAFRFPRLAHEGVSKKTAIVTDVIVSL